MCHRFEYHYLFNFPDKIIREFDFQIFNRQLYVCVTYIFEHHYLINPPDFIIFSFTKLTDTYDGPSVKEKINSNLFSLPFIGERR